MTSYKTAEVKRAEEKLAARKKRFLKRPGPTSLAFTITEIDSVRSLAAHGHTSATIATRAGLTSKQFRKAREKDETLSEALVAGKAEERLRITTALLKTATDPSNPRQVQAAVTLAKMRHGFVDGKAGGVEVNVANTIALPGPLDPRTYKKLIRESDNARAPMIIEHASEDDLSRRAPVDPVAAALSKRKESRDD